MGQPYYETHEWANRSPLKSEYGNERKKTVMVYASTVVADSMLRRRLSPGTFLAEIASGLGAGKYGPYDKTASDGRESPAEGGVVFSWEAHDVTLGDRAIAGLYAQCVFDRSEFTTNGYSLHGTPLANLKAMFPSCVFDD